MMSLFNSLGGGVPTPQMPSGMGGLQNIISRFQQFKKMFSGNPQQQVQQMLNSGRVSQEQYNQAVQMANQLQKLLK